jgi:hypothetical protein
LPQKGKLAKRSKKSIYSLIIGTNVAFKLLKKIAFESIFPKTQFLKKRYLISL